MNIKINKMKKVLIALDYDPTAQKVAEEGFKLAKSMGAEATLLHVISDPMYYSSRNYSPIMGFSGNITLDPLVLNSVDTLKQASLDFLDKSRHHLADETIQMIVEEGGYSETILKTAKKLHADIIVMGSHSQKWLENILVGSVTEEVLHHTTIPLFIVPTKKHN